MITKINKMKSPIKQTSVDFKRNDHMIAHYAINTAHFHALPKKPAALTLEPTATTPFLKYSSAENLLVIKGKSVKPDMHEFYHAPLQRFKAELKNSNQLKVHLCFYDLNTSTAKVLFDLFKYLRMRAAGGTNIEVIWGAEVTNHEMIETGKDFAEIYELKFRFLKDSDF